LAQRTDFLELQQKPLINNIQTKCPVSRVPCPLSVVRCPWSAYPIAGWMTRRRVDLVFKVARCEADEPLAANLFHCTTNRESTQGTRSPLPFRGNRYDRG